jgi:hypothetical protein
MENQLPKFIRKVKLKIVQPHIKCSGRDSISCYYRGKVIRETEHIMDIIIKVYNEETKISYDKTKDQCITFGFFDLKLVK